LFVYSRVLPDDFAEFLGVLSSLCVYIEALEIKPCGLGSRIRGMEAEWRLKVISLVSRNGAFAKVCIEI